MHGQCLRKILESNNSLCFSNSNVSPFCTCLFYRFLKVAGSNTDFLRQGGGSFLHFCCYFATLGIVGQRVTSDLKVSKRPQSWSKTTKHRGTLFWHSTDVSEQVLSQPLASLALWPTLISDPQMVCAKLCLAHPCFWALRRGREAPLCEQQDVDDSVQP